MPYYEVTTLSMVLYSWETPIYFYLGKSPRPAKDREQNPAKGEFSKLLNRNLGEDGSTTIVPSMGNSQLALF